LFYVDWEVDLEVYLLLFLGYIFSFLCYLTLILYCVLDLSKFLPCPNLVYLWGQDVCRPKVFHQVGRLKLLRCQGEWPIDIFCLHYNFISMQNHTFWGHDGWQLPWKLWKQT
jgi:hypothetical protein